MRYFNVNTVSVTATGHWLMNIVCCVLRFAALYQIFFLWGCEEKSNKFCEELGMVS